MQRRKLFRILSLVLILSLLLPSVLLADESIPTLADGTGDAGPAEASHRLIVQLESPALAEAFGTQVQAAGVDGKLDVSSSAAQNYIAQLQSEQAAFMADMQSALNGASVSTFINEFGIDEGLTYQVVFNGMAIDPGSVDKEEAKARLERMDGVRAVFYDSLYETQLYTSTSLINAPVVWNSSAIGGVGNAGAGIKVASMDGGVHKDAPMFDGTGYTYPDGFGPNGLGLTENNNGKIIASRTYFRSWDPPAAGDENPWPGENGTSHGVHTASTAAGNCVDGVTYAGLDVGSMCGVAPKAYVMSYRVFYESITENGSFYTAEGVAALEDIVADGPDVLNNSWGGGPGSEGGAFDALDAALINAANAGIFISMSNGNAGPGEGTADHPSSEYINVAASSTSGTLAAGIISVSAPAPVPDDLKDFAYSTTTDFGTPLPIGVVQEYDYLPALVVDPANVTGCSAFPVDAFIGKAALISRGGCFFADKFYYAEQAGAEFVVLYNNAGDGLINLGCGGDFCSDITVSGIFVGQTNGEAMVDWYNTNGAASKMEFNSIAFQNGNTPDVIIDFSSRGPAVPDVLKPDITAPGVNILAQGYTEGASGETRHLGYGQASGTSMAAPHVAGAAALLKQIYPGWSPAEIKSAMMSTSVYMDIYTQAGVPAQPLDMGAGRLDIAAAVDPGVILDPPSLSFGNTISGTSETINVSVTSVANAAETYSLSTITFGTAYTDTSDMAGVSVSPLSVSLDPGETKTVAVTFDGAGAGIGDNQGHVVMMGDNGHKAHMPAWARVIASESMADILIIDNDFSDGLGITDYLWYYTSTLDDLGLTYNVINVDDRIGAPTTIPEAAALLSYKAIIWFTGDNFDPDGTYTVSTGLTQLDQDRLTDYLNNGGTLIAMGQDLASATDSAEENPDNTVFLYTYRLAANYIQDSVSDSLPPNQFITSSAGAPAAFADVIVDLTQIRKTFGGGDLSGDNEAPPVDTLTSGEFFFDYDIDENRFDIAVSVSTTSTIEVTGAHIHNADAGANGPVVRSLDFDGVLPMVVTDTLDLVGSITDFTDDEIDMMLFGETYINVHTTANPSGEVRGQIEPLPVFHSLYVDEIYDEFTNGDPDLKESTYENTPLLKYQGPYNEYDGTVAIAHRDQISLERPGTTYSGRSIYTTFGLEGMSNDINTSLGYTPTTRSELIQLFLDWSSAEAVSVSIANTTPANSSGLTTFLASTDATAVSYRWDFGDGSSYVTSGSTTVGHTFACNDAGNTYTVRIELTDDLGIVSLGSGSFDVSDSCQAPTAIEGVEEPDAKQLNDSVYLPFVTQ